MVKHAGCIWRQVRITAGAMADMIGVLDRQKSGFRIVLMLEMIGRSVSVEVDLADIEPAGATANRTSVACRA